MVKPGEGKEYVTTPAGRNATLECSAINTTTLRWTVNTFDPNFFDSELSGLILHQSGPITASTGEMTSTLTVNGTNQNNGIEICCQITGPQQCCTNLIIYGNYFMYWHIATNLCCIHRLPTMCDRCRSILQKFHQQHVQHYINKALSIS